jgi:hypothetical protein
VVVVVVVVERELGCVANGMPTECNVNGLILFDGVKAAQSNLNAAATNRMK